MKKNYSSILLIIFLICIFFIGCPIPPAGIGNGNDIGNDISGSTYVPGSTLPSSIKNSTSLSLPVGVSASKINGGAISLISTYPLSIDLTNNTLTTYIYTFKAGSNFWADTGATQNLIIVWDIAAIITPGNNSTIILPTFCLNSSLHAPDTVDNFILGTVYTGGSMGQIINILSTKDPTTFNVFDLQIIQDAIWECMTDGILSPVTIANLNAL